MTSLLQHHARADAIAWSRGSIVSAGELVAQAAVLCAQLDAPHDGDELVVACRDRHHFAVALIAAWMRNYSVALPPSSQIEAIAALRRRDGIRSVIHDVDGIDRGIDVRSIAADAIEVAPLVFAPDRKLATVYTSGSTGASVACPKTASQLIGEAQTLVQTFELDRMRVASMVPAHHIYGLLFGVLVPMVSGGAYSRETPLHPAELEALSADVWITVPAHLRALARADRLPAPRSVFSSGAPLPPSVAEQLRLRHAISPIEVLGSSETGGIAWRQGDEAYRPLPGVNVSEEEGFLVLDSPFLHPGASRPHRCADRIQMSGEGAFLHLGRADGVIKVGGVRVSIAEIEERLRSIDGVHDVAAIAMPVEGPRGTEVWAAVVAPSLSAAQIRDALLRWLAPVAVPRRIAIVDALGRDENGKMKHDTLLSIFGQSRR